MIPFFYTFNCIHVIIRPLWMIGLSSTLGDTISIVLVYSWQLSCENGQIFLWTSIGKQVQPWGKVQVAVKSSLSSYLRSILMHLFSYRCLDFYPDLIISAISPANHWCLWLSLFNFHLVNLRVSICWNEKKWYWQDIPCNILKRTWQLVNKHKFQNIKQRNL